MCLGIPMQVNKIESHNMAKAETMGIKRSISVQLVPDVKVGDYVLVHAGFAIEIINPGEAEARIDVLKDLIGESP